MRVKPWQVAVRGVRHECPNCGGPLKFGAWMSLRDFCPACGMAWRRGGGFYLGAMVWNYAFVVFILLLAVVVPAIKGWMSKAMAMGVGVAVAFGLPFVFYRTSWSCWMASYYFFLPGELPANRTEGEAKRPGSQKAEE